MKWNTVIAAIAATLLLESPGSAQSAADLLQKGIYAQETAGDLDSAIRIFRQVASPASGNKTVAAQAQYQLVLCMLQRGDRPAAVQEVETLARNYPDQPELVTKARKLLPGGGVSVVSVPWGDGEASQFNLKQDGVATGDTLFYSIDPSPVDRTNRPTPNLQLLHWELTTKKSHRGVSLKADRITGRIEGHPSLRSNDPLGDPAVEPIAGPAIDIQGSIFAIRRLPLAVGFKTTLSTLPLTLTHLAPKDVELAVTGIEPVAVTAGKFKCYKVVFASLGQTFWFGVEGARPLVKFKAGNIEAELVQAWGPENLIETKLAFFRDNNWRFEPSATVYQEPGPEKSGRILQVVGEHEDFVILWVTATKVYTPAADIPQALRNSLAENCQPESIQSRTIGGQQAMSCVSPGKYRVWIRSENAAILLSTGDNISDLAVTRWQIDQVLAKAKRIP